MGTGRNREDFPDAAFDQLCHPKSLVSTWIFSVLAFAIFGILSQGPICPVPTCICTYTPAAHRRAYENEIGPKPLPVWISPSKEA